MIEPLLNNQKAPSNQSERFAKILQKNTVWFISQVILIVTSGPPLRVDPDVFNPTGDSFLIPEVILFLRWKLSTKVHGEMLSRDGIKTTTV